MTRTLKAICLASLWLLSHLAFAQGGAATGDLHVTVKDPKGSFVINATVTVRDPGKGLDRSAVSDGQGGYSARLLPPKTGNHSQFRGSLERILNDKAVVVQEGAVGAGRTNAGA